MMVLAKRTLALRGPLGALLVGAILLGAGFLLLPDASAERTPVMTSTLPTPRDGAAAVATSDTVLIFGGESTNGRLRDILHYDPVLGNLSLQDTQLPSGLMGAAAVWSGTHAYLFGGWTTSGYTDQILRYDPGTGTLQAMDALLPTARVHLAAAWVDGAAYLFGGSTNCTPCESDEILRYDPTSDTIQVMDATLPTKRAALAATTDGTKVTLFGGVSNNPFQAYKDILVYDPASDTIDAAQAQLPAGRYHLGAQWADGRAWIMGGTPCTNNSYCETILAFDPASDSLETHTTLLATGRHHMATASMGGHIYVIGGHDGSRLDQILRFSPPDAPPVEPPQPPQLHKIVDQTARVDAESVLAITATHPQGKATTLSAVTKPVGAGFTDHGDGAATLTWTPEPGDEGVHDVTVKADDGQLSTTRSFTIRVDPADAPFVTAISSRVIEAGTQLSVDIAAWDPENRAISLDIEPLPSGALFEDHGNGNATFDWPTTSAQIGTWVFTVGATADGKTGTATFQVDVRAIIQPPQLNALDPVTAIVDKTNSFTVGATHPDGDPITLSAEALPSGATFTDHGDGTATLQWTPHAGFLGKHDIDITAATEDRTATGILKVNVIREYDYSITALTAIQQVLSPGETLSLPSVVENTGNQSLTIRFKATTLQTKGSGWGLQAPDAITLAPGESETVVMNVTGTSHSVQTLARLRGIAEEDADLSRVQNFAVKVPVQLEVIFESAAVSAVAAATGGIPGEVQLSWANGSPATGLSVEVKQTPATGGNTLETSEDGSSDGQGRFAFSFQGDPQAALPGDHTVFVTVARSGTTDTHTSGYSVELL